MSRVWTGVAGIVVPVQGGKKVLPSYCVKRLLPLLLRVLITYWLLLSLVGESPE